MKYTGEQIKAFRKRLVTVETIVSLPAKVIVIAIAIFAISPFLVTFIKGNGAGDVRHEPFGTEQTLKLVTISIIGYFIATVLIWAALGLWKRSRNSIQAMKSIAVAIFVTDVYFLSLWLYVDPTVPDPVKSNLFWIYCLLIVRNILFLPEIVSQVVLTLSIMGSYVLVVGIGGDVGKASPGSAFTAEGLNALALRLVVLALVTISGWGLYEIYRRQREIADEIQERTIRIERLSLAGIVAKEAAHSLKNPLAIMNNACFLLRKGIDEDRQNVRKQIDVIANEVGRADRMISELMNYTVLAEGRLGRVDVNSEIRKCVADLKKQMEGKNIIVEKRLSESLPRLLIDEWQLKQVISNILVNAVQAIEGDGEITVKTEELEDGEIAIEIEDSGCGMEEEALHRIFRVDYTTKKGGTGLGLSIVHTIVQAYNGRINVDSKVGVGTKFSILFPTRTERVEVQV